jgi:hypothetical protein
MATVNARNLYATLNTPGGPVDRALKLHADAIKREASVRVWPQAVIHPSLQTFTYARSFFARRGSDADIRRFSPGANAKLGWAAGNDDPKANWIEYGTGVFGPYHQPIVPRRRGGLLVFKAASGDWVATRSVQGRPATPVVTEAARRYARRFSSMRYVEGPPNAAKQNRIRSL